MPNYKRKRAPHQTGRGKNHSTNKERSQGAQKKARVAKFKVAARDRRMRKVKNAIRAFWAGEKDDHPIRS